MADYMCPPDPTVTHCYHAAKVNELIAEREAEVEQLRAALTRAIEEVELWAGCVSTYLKDKHDYAGALSELRAALEVKA